MCISVDIISTTKNNRLNRNSASYMNSCTLHEIPI